jgi:glyoxylase-like metal-dependent hydrolase (beta-lactamase superfamily II)/8-oxo-dGTP pyrophosphatase MutT (NUDIX family)
VSVITQAASVLLTRGPGSSEVFVVRRAQSLRFFGGFLAFPGGKVAPTDVELETIPSARSVPSPAVAPERFVAAARELFEETGVLLARRPDGSFPASGPELDHLRRQLSDGGFSFPQILKRLGLVVRRDDFAPLGGVTTPAFTNLRFDTMFFVAHQPSNQHAEVWTGELDQGYWATAAEVLQCWTRGECLVSPPTVMILEAIRDRPADEAPARLGPLLHSLEAGALHPIYFAPDVQLLPLRTLSLPPSTHTNAYLVGRGPVYLIDPGTGHADEQERLFAVLDAHRAAGRALTAVVLTHHHPDHVGAVNACVERYRLPVFAHPRTADALRGRITITRELHEGDHLDLGEAPDGRGRWHLEALHTPGHAPGHLAFYEPRYRLLLAGDMISTLSSVVIAPPDGNLIVYLDSLRRLQTYDCRLLLPAHGTASARPRETLDEAIVHRVKREEQLVMALGPAPRRVADLAQELYQGLPPTLMRFAELQVQAGLEKLRVEGRVDVAGEGKDRLWRLSTSGGVSTELGPT